MLFTLTKEQYQRYKDNAVVCRQYILDKYQRLCSVIDTFNRCFGADHVDICSSRFCEKSLLLTLLEDYEQHYSNRPIAEYLDTVFNNNRCFREGVFQNLAIYVWWPSVTVTNERNQSVNITDLYAEIPICPNGNLYEYFMLSRASYTYEQYISTYMHSHVHGINMNPSVFLPPCLGSGPLVRTQSSLRDGADLWDLFCAELDRYVHVESTEGIPYRYLSNIGIGTNGSSTPIDMSNDIHNVLYTVSTNVGLKALFSKFFKYILAKKRMRFAFAGGMYVSPYTSTEWVIKLSNQFIKFFALMSITGKTLVTQDELIEKGILVSVKIHNGILYHPQSAGHISIDYTAFRNRHVLYFKGQDVCTTVDDPATYEENISYVINPALATGFLDQCLNYLNIYEHEKERNVIQENQQGEIGDRTFDSNGGSSRHQNKNTFRDYPVGEKRVILSL